MLRDKCWRVLWAYSAQGRYSAQEEGLVEVKHCRVRVFIDPFSLAIGLWVEAGGETQRGSRELAEGLPKTASKLGTLVRL